MEYRDLSPGNKQSNTFPSFETNIFSATFENLSKRRLTKTRFKGNAGNLQTIFDINQRIMEEPREFS